MQRRLSILSLGFLLLSFARPAAAQVCLGAPSFQEGRTQFGIGGDFASSERTFNLSFGAGGENLFGRGMFGIQNVNDADSNGYGIGATVGADRVVSGSSGIHVCPVASVMRFWGPSFSTLDTRQFDLALGGSMGFVIARGSSMAIVPTVGMAFDYANRSLTVGTRSVGTSSNFGSVDFGAGVLVSTRTMLQLIVDVPFGLDNGEASFHVGLVHHFTSW
jgi:hypothetical protein